MAGRRGSVGQVRGRPHAGRLTTCDIAGTAAQLTRESFPELDDTSVSVGLALVRAAQAHSSRSEGLVHRPEGRTWHTFRVLYLLWLFDGIEARDLARVADLSRQTVSNILAGLEGEGFVSRQRRQEDRRLVTLRLTDRGRAHLEKSLEAQFRLEEQWFSVLTCEERRTLTELLERLGASIRGTRDADVVRQQVERVRTA